MNATVWAARGIRRLFVGGVVAETADWALLVALPLFVFSLTASPLATSTVFIVQTALTVVSAPIAGVLIDRVNAWRLMGATAALQMVALVPLLFVTGGDDLWLVYVVVVAQALLGAIIEPCRPSTAAALVSADQVPGANQLLGIGSSLARLVGAPVGGFVIGVGGVTPLVATAGVFYLVATVVLGSGPRVTTAGAAPTSHPLADMRDGLRVVRRTSRLARLMLVAALMAVAQGLFTILFLLFVLRDLGGGEAEVGVLRGVQAVGALVAGLALIRVVAKASPSRLASGSLLLFALLSFAVWNAPLLTTNFAVYVVLFVLVGAPGLTAMTALLTIAEYSSPATHRGRVTSLLFAALTAFQSLGMLAGGLVGTGVGLTIALQVQASLYLLAGLVALSLRTGRSHQERPRP
ncbi:MFS transporter [Arthrobacter sp. MDT1-65]